MRRLYIICAVVVVGFLGVFLFVTIYTTTPVPTASNETPAGIHPYNFTEGFEVNQFSDLFTTDALRWHTTQQQPEGNTVELVSSPVHSGQKSLKFTAQPTGEEISKADIVRGGFSFKKGDDVWFSGWFYLEGDEDSVHPIFIWDLEDERYKGGPGRRIYLSGSDWITSDMKWSWKWLLGAKNIRQDKENLISFPKNTWINLKIHMYLSEGNDGKLKVWQDGLKVLDANGATLPIEDVVYNRMQVGITANPTQDTHILYVDDIKISNQEGVNE